MSAKKKETFISQRITIDDKVFIVKISDISTKRNKYLYTVTNGEKELTKISYSKLSDNNIVELVKKLFNNN